jgi:hypothetical protein
MSHRPDYSEFVAHFTSAVAIQGDAALNDQIGSMSALERLASILSEGTIRATKKYYSLGGPSVAFTECPWTSLLDHAFRYSSYGVGFTKQFLWDRGGQPAVYMRSEVIQAMREHVEAQASRSVYPAIAPEVGALYTPLEREAGWRMLNGVAVQTHVDFSHEREWRVLADVPFTPSDVQLIIVDKFSDVSRLPSSWVQAVGEDRVLSMSNYRRIMELWPP